MLSNKRGNIVHGIFSRQLNGQAFLNIDQFFINKLIDESKNLLDNSHLSQSENEKLHHNLKKLILYSNANNDATDFISNLFFDIFVNNDPTPLSQIQIMELFQNMEILADPIACPKIAYNFASCYLDWNSLLNIKPNPKKAIGLMNGIKESHSATVVPHAAAMAKMYFSDFYNEDFFNTENLSFIYLRCKRNLFRRLSNKMITRDEIISIVKAFADIGCINAAADSRIISNSPSCDIKTIMKERNIDNDDALFKEIENKCVNEAIGWLVKGAEVATAHKEWYSVFRIATLYLNFSQLAYQHDCQGFLSTTVIGWLEQAGEYYPPALLKLTDLYFGRAHLNLAPHIPLQKEYLDKFIELCEQTSNYSMYENLEQAINSLSGNFDAEKISQYKSTLNKWYAFKDQPLPPTEDKECKTRSLRF